MKAAISGWLISALVVLCNVTSFAQTTPPVSGATLVATFSAFLTVDDDTPILDGEVSTAHVEITGWLTEGGETIFSINVNSITFTGPCEWAEGISLKVFMDQIAKSALTKALNMGYALCTPCPSSLDLKVYYPTCVQRNTMGFCPVFTAATGTTFSYNTYNTCCSSGAPSVSKVSSTCGSGSCGSGYNLTCY